MDQRQQVTAIHDKVIGITDLDWSELAVETGMGIHPDQLRKMGAGIKLAMEAGMLSLEDGGKGKYDLQKMRDVRNEINMTCRSEARSEALRDAIIEATGKLNPVRVDPLPRPHPSSGRSLVVALGDFHYGAEWKVRGLCGEILNEYNPEIFEGRMQRLLSQIIEILQKEAITHVDLQMCGDTLDGMLRASQLMKLRWGVVESLMRLSEYLAQWIGMLSKYCGINVYSVDGNHGEIRPLGSKRGEYDDENMEKILTWYLDARLSGIEGIDIDPVSESMKLIDVQGYTILLTHGTQAKTLEALVKQTLMLYGKKVDFIICAHKHREQEMVSGYTDDGNTMVLRIPCICGMDSYAQSLGYGGKPGALAMVMERGYGRRCVYPIRL